MSEELEPTVDGEVLTPDRPDAPDAGVGEGDGALDLEAVVLADPRDRHALLADLVATERQRDEYLDDLRRAHADFENYRRRVVRDGAVQREQGRIDALTALLDVLDDLDRSLAVVREAAAAGTVAEGVSHGVELVAAKLVGATAGLGLVRIDAVDVPFDPTEHEAVQQLGDDAEPLVSQVLRPGYRYGDRVLRAAMVVVGR